jgi:hypothetical protein
MFSKDLSVFSTIGDYSSALQDSQRNGSVCHVETSPEILRFTETM